MRYSIKINFNSLTSGSKNSSLHFKLDTYGSF